MSNWFGLRVMPPLHESPSQVTGAVSSNFENSPDGFRSGMKASSGKTECLNSKFSVGRPTQKLTRTLCTISRCLIPNAVKIIVFVGGVLCETESTG